MDYYSNPEAVLDTTCDHQALRFIHDKRLGDFISDIELDGSEEVHYDGEKPFEPNDQKFLKLANQIGWIHFSNGTTFRIDHGEIVAVKLSKQSLGCLAKLTASQLIRKCGDPEAIQDDFIVWVFDYTKYADVYVYKKLDLTVSIDTETGRVREVFFPWAQNPIL